VQPETLNEPGAVKVTWVASNSTGGMIDEFGPLTYMAGHATRPVSRTTTFVGRFWDEANRSTQCFATVRLLSRRTSAGKTADGGSYDNGTYYDTYESYNSYSSTGSHEYHVFPGLTGDQSLNAPDWAEHKLPSSLPGCRLKAVPSHLSGPGNIRLAWESWNAANGKIDGFGILDNPTGYVSVHLLETSTFVATFTNADNDRERCSITVTVNPSKPPSGPH
jgi:hypothetical protein